MITEGGDLRETQVDVSLFLLFLLLTTSLGSRTDTLILTGEYAYANDLKLG
jgi:hypothetical protein